MSRTMAALLGKIKEIEKAPRQRLNASFFQGHAHRLLVIDHQPEVPAIIGRLPAALLKGEELVAEIDESSIFALAVQLEVEQPAIKCQRLVDVADFDRNVIEADRAGLLCFGHGSLHIRSA
jgi:hypothetical protein